MDTALDPDDWAALQRVGRVRHYKAGQTVLRQGDPARQVAAINAGIVKVSHSTIDGQMSILAIRGAGELIGEMGALEKRPRGADATAVTECEICMIKSEDFVDFLETRGAVAVRLLRMVLERQREADESVIARNTTTLETRLARGLLELAERYGRDEPEGRVVAIALTQEDLAAWIGGSRSEINRALRRFAEEGLLVTSRRKYTLVDPAGLAAYLRPTP